jgi:hypothetical protein
MIESAMRDTEVTRSPETKDRWVVMVPSGDTRAVTLDELDEEFNAGRIDGTTLVLAPGAVFWTPLAEIAGLDDEASPAPAASKPIPSEPPSSDGLANLAVDLEVDVDLDLDLELRPKRRWGRLLALPGALGLVAAIAFAASASDARPEEKAAAAAEAPRAAAPIPPPAPDGAASAAPATKPSLSDDQKRALANKDKKAAQATKAKADARVASPKRSTKSSSSPFRKGGDPHDPMNAKL